MAAMEEFSLSLKQRVEKQLRNTRTDVELPTKDNSEETEKKTATNAPLFTSSYFELVWTSII